MFAPDINKYFDEYEVFFHCYHYHRCDSNPEVITQLTHKLYELIQPTCGYNLIFISVERDTIEEKERENGC